MTTIAWDGKALAADSLLTDDVTAVEVCKLIRTPDGMAGAAGELAECAGALGWLAAGSDGDPPSIINTTVLFVRGTECYMAAVNWPGIRVKRCAAIGSGAQGALVAMRMGLSAGDAVKAVAGIDPSTGGEIDVMESVHAKPRRARRS